MLSGKTEALKASTRVKARAISIYLYFVRVAACRVLKLACAYSNDSDLTYYPTTQAQISMCEKLKRQKGETVVETRYIMAGYSYTSCLTFKASIQFNAIG